MIRLRIDLGGTKIEIVALDESGSPVARHRTATPQGSYRAILSPPLPRKKQDPIPAPRFVEQSEWQSCEATSQQRDA